MRSILKRHRDYWSNRQFTTGAIVAMIFFILCSIVHFQAGVFATKNVSNSVTDLLLTYLPVVNVNIVFVEGSILFWLFVTTLIINRPQRIPFVLKALGLFMLTRSLFIILTHLGPDPRQIVITYNSIIDKFTFGGDFFFSGHTGAPFLMSLIFWQHKGLRWLFLISSVVFGISVLLGHIHYSIDVFGAYFITYGIYQMALKFFIKDYKLLRLGR